MGQEFISILLFVVVIVTYGVIRYRHKRRYKEAEMQVIQCDITYRDRVTTQAFLEAFFALNQINVLSSNCYFESGENEEVYSSVYMLILPENLTAAQVVSQISAYKMIRSICAKTKK